MTEHPPVAPSDQGTSAGSPAPPGTPQDSASTSSPGDTGSPQRSNGATSPARHDALGAATAGPPGPGDRDPGELKRMAARSSVGCIALASGGAGLLSLTFAAGLFTNVLGLLAAATAEAGASIIGVLLYAICSVLFLTFALLLLGFTWSAMGQLKSPPVRRGMPWAFASAGFGLYGLVLLMVGLTEFLEGATGAGIATIVAALPAGLFSLMAVRIRSLRREVRAKHDLLNAELPSS